MSKHLVKSNKYTPCEWNFPGTYKAGQIVKKSWNGAFRGAPNPFYSLMNYILVFTTTWKLVRGIYIYIGQIKMTQSPLFLPRSRHFFKINYLLLQAFNWLPEFWKVEIYHSICVVIAFIKEWSFRGPYSVISEGLPIIFYLKL